MDNYIEPYTAERNYQAELDAIKRGKIQFCSRCNSELIDEKNWKIYGDLYCYDCGLAVLEDEFLIDMEEIV